MHGSDPDTKKKEKPDHQAQLIAPELLMDAPIGIYTTTPEGRFLSANRTMARMLGYDTPKELIESITDLSKQVYVNPDDRQNAKTLLETYGEVSDYECQWLRRNGKGLWISLNARAVTDESGNILYYQGFASNIAKRKHNEEDLRKIEWMLSGDQSVDSVQEISSGTHAPPYGDLTNLNTSRLILDSVGKETLRNIVNEYLEMQGTSAAVYEKNGDYALGIFSSSWCRFMDQSSRSLCNTDDNGKALASGKWLCHESCWNISKQCIETGNPVDAECSGGLRLYTVPVRAGGDVIGAINFGYGNPPTDFATLDRLASQYAVSKKTLRQNARSYETRPPFIIDLAKRRIRSAADLIGEIVERKQAEHKLRESEEKYRFMTEQMNDVIWTSDLEMRVTYISPSDERILGFTREERVGHTLADMLTHASQEKAMEALSAEHALEETGSAGFSRSVTIELEYKHKDGSTRWLETLAAGIRDDEGRLIGMHGVSRDISERKQTEKARWESEEKSRHLEEQLYHAQKMESMGRLAGGVAHDFNNMLTIINGYAEMMADVLPSSDPMYESVHEIQDAGKRSAVIVRKLLAFARKQTIAPVPMNLNDSVSGMLKMLHRLIGENIDLLWKPCQNAWRIKMDFSQIDQILVNLVVNAYDAIADTGKITIETETIEFDEQYCANHAGFVPGQYVMLAVSDNGCGMDKHVLDNLFEPFFTTKEVGKGTGLGMPTVYGIVKQNNGFINVYSEAGQGTTIRIYFPRYLSDADIPDRKKEKTPAKGRGETILVLEDETVVLNLTRIMLGRLGYNVITSNSPREAMELAKTHDGNIDLLLTDVVMPEMNGREFADQLNGLFPEIKVLFMSGYTANVIAHHTVLDKGVSFIEKPFSINRLAAKVRAVLE